jgi:alkyldihydroxyacetonephosphate synthase
MNATQIRKSLPDTAWRRLESELAMPALLVTPARALDDIDPGPGRIPPNILDGMIRLLGPDRVRTGLAARAGHTASLAGLLRLRQGDLGAVPDAVLSPRRETEVTALLGLCAGAGIAIGTPASDAAHVALDLTALDTIDEVDGLSGRVRAGGGVSMAALDAELAARGLMLEGAGAEPADTVASRAYDAAGLNGIRLATPQGLATVENDPALAPLMARSGVVTAATLAVCRRPQETQLLAWRFTDFAAGLAALREAARGGIALVHPRLSDERETGLFASLEPDRGRLAALWGQLRKPAEGGALLWAHMARADHVRFKSIARHLGGRPARPQTRMSAAALRAALLEHGAALDRIAARAPWAKLPALYAAARAALDAAMLEAAPRDGARGMVLASLSEPQAQGARLVLTWIYARKLGDEAAQALAIRARAQAAMARQDDRLTDAVRRAIADTLDPAGIVQPIRDAIRP